MATWKVKLDGVDYSDRLLVGQIRVEYVNGSVGNLECTIIDTGSPATALRPAIEQLIEIIYGTTTFFYGRIIATDENPLVDANSGTATRVTALDYHRALVKRAFSKRYGQFQHYEIGASTSAIAQLTFPNDNTGLILTTREKGSSIEGRYSIQLVDPGAANQSFTATEPTTGQHILYLATDASGNITTTASYLRTWINANAVFTAEHDTGSDGSGVVRDLPRTFLTGAEDGTLEIIVDNLISVVGTGNPATITTTYPHGLTTGNTVQLDGVTGSTPDVNGNPYQITVVNATQFTIAVNVTVAGTGGKVSKLTRLRTVIEDVMSILTPYGMTLSMTGDGPWLMPVEFVRAWIEDVVTAVCKAAGWTYRVTPDLDFEVFEAGTVTAGFSLTAANANVLGAVPQRRTREEYANRLRVLYGVAGGIAALVDVFAGDGSTQVWTTATPFIPSTEFGTGRPNARGYVWINDVATPMGIYGVDAMTWTFDSLNSQLHHSGSPIPPVGTVIRLDYSGDSQQEVLVPDPPPAEIYEAIVDAGVRSKESATVLGEQEILVRNQTTRTVTIETNAGFVLPGTLITVNIPDRLMSGSWMVMRTTINDGEWRDATGTLAFYVYELLEDGPYTSWVDFWKDLLSGGAGGGSVSAIGSGGSSSGGGGGGNVIGFGTSGFVPKWSETATLVDSIISESGGIVTASGSWNITGNASISGILTLGTPTMRSGSGSPEGVIAAPVGSLWLRSDGSGELYRKASGTGNTGWTAVGGGVSGSGTANKFARWTSASTLGDGILEQDVGATKATVNGGLDVTGVTTLAGLLNTNGGIALDTDKFTVADGTGNVDTQGHVGHPSYASQASRWRIDATGNADFRYVYTDALHAKAFIADLEQALAGGQIICKSVAKIAADFIVGTHTRLIVESFAGFATVAVFVNGDYIRLRAFNRLGDGSLAITDAYGTVVLDTTYGTSGFDAATMTQAYTWTKTSGSNFTAAKGTLALDYGYSQGFYEVTANDGTWAAWNAPYAQTVKWTSSPPVFTVTSRLGNLRGITGVNQEFGLFAGVQYAATGGQWLRASSSGVHLHGIDLFLWDGATNTVKIDHAVPSFALGNPLPTAYATGAGIWMGKDGGVYKFRVGNPAGDRLTWDGTDLHVVGTITVDASSTINGLAASSISGWAHASDTTKIDGGDIYTGSITAEKILVQTNATALNQSPGFEDLAAWTLSNATRYTTGAGYYGQYVVRCTAGQIGYVGTATARKISFDRTKNYRIHAIVNGDGTGGFGTFSASLEEFDAAGNSLQTTNAISITSTGTLTAYTGVIASTSFHANTTQVILYCYLNGNATAGWVQVQNFRLEEQLPSTLIRDGAIITDKLAANAVTAAKIAANTITTNELAFTPVQTSNVVASINATAEGIRIAGNRITVDGTVSFGSGYDPTGRIASGGAAADVNANVTTISGGKITANSIDANRLNVATLSAISANLGTITAGSISGVTITAAGSVTLDGDGLSLTAGEGNANEVSWSDGSLIAGRTSVPSLHMRGPSSGGRYSQINLYPGSCDIWGNTDGGGAADYVGLDQNEMSPNPTGSIALGSSGSKWSNLYLSGDIYQTPATTTSADDPVVYSGAAGKYYRRANCTSNSITVVTDVDFGNSQVTTATLTWTAGLITSP